MNPDQNNLSDAKNSEDSEHPFEHEIDERLRAIKNPTERRTLAGLLREISHLQLEHTRAALETSAVIAAVSFRARYFPMLNPIPAPPAAPAFMPLLALAAAKDALSIIATFPSAFALPSATLVSLSTAPATWSARRSSP